MVTIAGLMSIETVTAATAARATAAYSINRLRGWEWVLTRRRANPARGCKPPL